MQIAHELLCSGDARHAYRLCQLVGAERIAEVRQQVHCQVVQILNIAHLMALSNVLFVLG